LLGRQFPLSVNCRDRIRAARQRDDGALNSNWVKQELEWASEYERQIGRNFLLPVVVAAKSDDVLPDVLRHRVQLRLTDHTEASVSTLASQIAERLFQLVVRSFEWRTSERQQTVTVCCDSADVTQVLQAELRDRNITQASMIQYSGRAFNQLVGFFLDRGANVSVYLQSPKTARELGSEKQSAILEEAPTWLVDWLSVAGHELKIRIYRYSVPASLCGILVDDDLLVIGWYLYKNPERRELLAKYPNDRVDVIGAPVPKLVLRAGTKQFDDLAKEFNKQLTNLQRRGLELCFPSDL
jgi:hypothetical protein